MSHHFWACSHAPALQGTLVHVLISDFLVQPGKIPEYIKNWDSWSFKTVVYSYTLYNHAPLGCTNDFSYQLFKALYIVIASSFGYMSYIMNNLGCQQADFTGLRLLELKLPYKLIIHSTMTRARETANHIHKHLEGVPMTECNMLVEGAPFPPEPPLSSWKPDHKVYLQKTESSKRRLECHIWFLYLWGKVSLICNTASPKFSISSNISTELIKLLHLRQKSECLRMIHAAQKCLW